LIPMKVLIHSGTVYSELQAGFIDFISYKETQKKNEKLSQNFKKTHFGLKRIFT
jgi:hypothetical protein